MFRERRQGRRAEQEQGHQTAELRKNVLGLMHRGQISKAANRIVSHGIANHADPHVQEQLKAKFPPRKKLLPQTVRK